MTRQENPNFVASKYAPNPKEVSYWIDLSSDTTGNVIKSFDGKQWIPTNYKENTDQSERIDALDASLASEISRAKSKEQQLENTINTIDNTHSTDIQEVRESINELDSSKADKATTLAGYGITDAYTKTQADSKATEIAKAECAKLVASAPETLDTLDEIAAALGDDPNFATTITNLIGTKADTATVNASLDTKADKATTLAGYGITDAYTKTQADSKATEIAKAECAKLVASAPETLDTLDEIAAALGDDPNFATTITNLIGTKADTATVNASLDTKADKATTYTKTEVDTKLNAKANSADVYTKSQTNTAISDATNNKVTSTSVNSIQIVDAIPEADSQVTGVLYIKLSTAA